MASRAPSNRLPPSSEPTNEDRRAHLTDRLDSVAGTRNWTWPVVSALAGLVGVTILAFVHRLIDLGTYLLGGNHAFHSDLYQVLYRPTHLGFTYPPFAAIAFAPISHSPVLFDQVVFSWLSFAAVFGIIAISLRVCGRDLGRRTIIWWALLLVTPVGLLDPIRETLLLGQVNILLGLAVIADMTLVPRGRRGYLVGIAAAIKLTPLILIPYMLFTRQRGPALRALVTFVTAGALSAIVSPSASRTYWVHDVWKPNGAGWLPWVGNQGAAGVFERLLHHQLSATSMFLLIVPVVVVGLGIAVRAYRVSSPLLGFLVIEATESIASPVSWAHHFIWVVLLIAWLALAPDRPVHGEWWALAVAAVFWAAPIWWVPHGPGVRYAGHGWTILLADSFFVVLVAVVVAALVRLVRRERRERSTLRIG